MQLPIMDNDETTTDTANAGTRPRRSRQPKADRRVCIYRVIDGNAKEQGSFPEAVIGDPLERRLPTFLKEMFGAGEYKVDLRKTNGHFERSFPISIAESEPERERIIDIEREEFDDDRDEYSFPDSPSPGQMSAADVENMLLKERLKRFEEDARRQKSGSHSETHVLISALEESRREQRELMMMMLNQSQKPQQDATLQAMNMLEKSFGMITKAKALSEEIAPSGSSEGDGGYMAGGAKLLDSIGRNAGTFLPLLAGLMPKSPPMPTPAVAHQEVPFPQGSQNGHGEFADLAEQINQKKETVKK